VRKYLLVAAVAAIVGLALDASPALARKHKEPSASGREIRIGNIMPYSGPASAYATIGKVEAAYFKKVNDEGGISGRKIRFISVDDGYNPAKAVEMARRLVERDQVLLIFNPLGTPSNTAIRGYMNKKKVPQLFVASGASKWGDPEHFPWTMGGQPNYQSEGRIYAQHILKRRPNARIAVLYQNDDYGKDYLQGFKDGLGAEAKRIVAEASYEVTDPTIDSQIIALRSSGADVFFNISTPKFAAMAIGKAYDLGWHPIQYLNNLSISVGSVLKPAGLEKSIGLISVAYYKDPTDKRWEDDPAIKEWKAFMQQYYPQGNASDSLNVYGYLLAQMLEQVLRQAGDQLTRANVMHAAANLKDLQLPLALPGVKVNTSPTDYFPFESMQLQRFDGKQWVLFGEVVGR